MWRGRKYIGNRYKCDTCIKCIGIPPDIRKAIDRLFFGTVLCSIWGRMPTRTLIIIWDSDPNHIVGRIDGLRESRMHYLTVSKDTRIVSTETLDYGRGRNE